MLKNEKKIIQWNRENKIKAVIVIVVILFIIKTISSLFIGNDYLQTFSESISSQNQKFNSLDTKINKDLKEWDDGVNKSLKQMSDMGDDLDQRLANFQKEFKESFQEAIDKHNELAKNKYLSEFFELHVNYYDKNLYESERKKTIKETNYSILNYDQYNQMRELAKHCYMVRHNNDENKIYKNKIAHLKVEHNEREIKYIQKPNLWTWPLTKGQLNQITDDNYRMFFFVLDKGKCPYENE